MLTPDAGRGASRAPPTASRTRALFTVAAFTGLRLGELRALRWGDVDFAKRLVHVRRSYTHGEAGPPKSGKVRSVPLIDQAMVPLDASAGASISRAPTTSCSPAIAAATSTTSALRSASTTRSSAPGSGAMRTKPEPIIFHDLRHTFGTLAVQAFPLSDVKAYMGHADIQTTMIYVHHVPRHDAAARLSAIVGEEAGPALLGNQEPAPGRLLIDAVSGAEPGSHRA